MTFGASAFGESPFAGTVLGAPAPSIPGGGEEQPPVSTVSPFTIEISGVAYRPMTDSVTIDMEFGRQGSASFRFANINVVPQLGEQIRILYYQSVLFVGSVNRRRLRSDPSHSIMTLDCEAVDNTYLLVRRKIKRSFANVSVTAIASALISLELANDGITLGTIDNLPTLPTVDADSISAFELFTSVAISVGAVFSIDNDRKLNFVTQSLTPAPATIDESLVEEVSLSGDRETFRNAQTVIVTGKPISDSDQPLTISYTAKNSNQIPQQAILEGTSGEYNDITSITHPTSNFTIDLTKLAVAYAKTLLSVYGVLGEIMTVRTRQHGFQVGQLAPVSIPHQGRSGNWLIQKVTMREEAGLFLITTLDLSPSSLRRFSQELWLKLVEKGSVTVIPPTAITTHTQIYSTPGTYQFTVPVGATFVQVTCEGAGGGGGGGAYHAFFTFPVRYAGGAPGGRGGLSISVLDVVPGEVLTIVVPSGGAGGATDRNIGIQTPAAGVNGGTGGTARVSRNGNFSVGEAYGGQGGFGGQANAITGLAATYPASSDGSGLFGNVITPGGGAVNGGGGDGVSGANGQAGGNGRVTVEW